ncbi:hypothetical protein pkur_cds_500 [Pandoravirus kuranda]|uniref:Uncharacterized protein n=2 Tax=Pandoravirus TaxID=2060084 RepID=A0AA95EE04_9VIRU|nr:hypothetical protein pneo_cds_535 [Pandoravirus neocaledonia]AVK76142.1 hypothetical protein pneo_cds_535 [Pandoravirus neocaledonia]WBR14674.1 hypothetical protein pkur_cds_500 [Pandoravirus kuranda]
MDFLSNAMQRIRGYGPVAADAPPQARMIVLDGRSFTRQEYEELKEKVIRIIQALPATYLSRDKADAAIAHLRAEILLCGSGIDRAHGRLFQEVYDAAGKYSNDLRARKTRGVFLTPPKQKTD